MSLVDQANRRRAMTDFTSVLLVEAAAGTGKTSLMAGRIAMMLANGHELGEIAAITFTELAASQLARRIKDTVDSLLLNDIPAFIQPVLPDGRLTDTQHASLSSAAARLDDLTVTTIHGFCQAILHTHGLQAGLDPGARVVDAPVADALFLTELSAWFSRRLAADALADDPIVVLAKEIPLEVVGLIRELAILRRKHPDAAPILPDPDARPDITFVQAVDDFDRWQSSERDRWAHEIARSFESSQRDMPTLSLPFPILPRFGNYATQDVRVCSTKAYNSSRTTKRCRDSAPIARKRTTPKPSQGTRS